MAFRRLQFAIAAALPLSAQVNVLTYQYDLSRAGANLQEPTLSKSNVNARQFGKLFSYPVDGYIYGQPLYLAGVRIPGKGAHNVVYVATEHDSVYAFDADTNSGPNSAPLWSVNFLNAQAGVTAVPYADTGCSQIQPEMGISGTPVIDAASGMIYLVAMTKEPGPTYVHRLHALDVATGAERPGSPVVVQPGSGFVPKSYKQRPGLLLLNGVVYTAWSSHCDIGQYHGWLIGYDAHTLQPVAVYNATPGGNQGSFWSGGAAPAADAAGNIYVASGNGSFDYASGGKDLGESYVKLGSSAALPVLDYFTPFNYASLNPGDADTGSAGVALLGDEAGSAAHPHLMAGAGKEGRVYLLDRDHLGGWQNGSDSQIVQSIPGGVGGLFGNPAYFNHALYFCGSGDNLKAFSISNAQITATPASQSAAPFGFPGCVPSISANGTDNGIVWILEAAPALHAFDGSNLGNELYNSGQNQARDALGGYVKFSVPAIANGKVYAGTQSALVVYGLLPGTAAIAVNNSASGDTSAVAPGSLLSIYGTGLAQSTASAAGFPLPFQLAGASVSINGMLAPILYASSSQLNVQIPFEAAPGSTAVVTTPAGTASIAIAAAAPGIFLTAPSRAAVLNADSSVNSASNPAAAGSEIAIFATGLGAVNNAPADGIASGTASTVVAPVTATVGGQPAQVVFAGLAPGYAGLNQVNLIVPALPAGDYPVQLSVGGAASNAAAISVR